MSNYIVFDKNNIAVHPGYYIEEIVNESGLTQEDFAKRLGTTPKNLSLLVRGEQSLSIDIAMKLSRLLGTGAKVWLNLQSEYDALIAERKSEEELEKERSVFKCMDYVYFRKNYGLPALSKEPDEQIKALRTFLNVATLSVLTKKDMAVCFRGVGEEFDETDTVRANAIVQIAVNEALKIEASKFDKKGLLRCLDKIIEIARGSGKREEIRKALLNAGVVLVISPTLKNCKINGATKIVGNKILLMVNGDKLSDRKFYFILFHEIAHILYGDFGMSVDNHAINKEDHADTFADEHIGYIYKKEYRGSFIEAITSFSDDFMADGRPE